MKLFVLLPCYNEAKALPFLFDSMLSMASHIHMEHIIVVINDGSTDGTAVVAGAWSDRLNIVTINHPSNMGLGAAVSTGLSYFCDNCDEGDAAVVMDGDNTHDPGLIPLMLDKMNQGNDVVIASRYAYGGREIGLSYFRRLCSACASLLLSFFFRIPGVRDYTCGYRLYSCAAVREGFRIFGGTFIQERGFTCMAEIMIKLHYLGHQISEVPLTLRYDMKMGKSKMKVFDTIIRYFALINNSRSYKREASSKLAYTNGEEK
jgi:dolichol-phosphate mannosyltransferase